MCARKRYMAFLLVLLVACCSVWAFPGRKEAKQKTQEDLIPPVQEIQLSEIEVKNEKPTLLPELKKPEISVKNSQENKDSEVNAYVQRLIDLLEEQATNQIDAESDIERLLEENETLKATNSKQADEIAYNQGLLDRNKRVRGFGTIRTTIGFKDKIPTYGFGAELGLKTSLGLMMSAGADYTIGSFVSPAVYEFSIDNLSFSLGLGFEW